MAHRTLAFASFALILVHLNAALSLDLIRRDGVFEAMAPAPDRGFASQAEQEPTIRSLMVFYCR